MPPKKKAKPPLKCPDGYARLQFINQAQALLNNSEIPDNLTHKLNMHLGEVALMVRDKYRQYHWW